MRRLSLFAVLSCFCATLMLPTAPTADASPVLQAASTLVKNINTATQINPLPTVQYVPKVVGKHAYFVNNDSSNGSELWTTDGTTASTRLFYDLYPGYEDSNPRQFIDLNGRFLFTARSPGSLLWQSDGTTVGTQLVVDPQTGKAINTGGNEIFSDGNSIYFHSFEGVLWKSDGTPQGTLVLYSGTDLGFVSSYLGAQGKVFFFSSRLNTNLELWQSDGSPAGTQRIVELATSASFADETAVVGSTLFFRIGDRLWRSDGTAAGTQQILSLSASDGGLTNHLGQLYYHAVFSVTPADPQALPETHTGLFRLAPASSSPELVYDFGVGARNGPSPLLSRGARIYFEGENKEIWASDGTTTGPVRTAGGAKVYHLGTTAVRDGSLVLGATQHPDAVPLVRDLWAIDLTTGIARLIHQTGAGEGIGPEYLATLGTTILFSSGETIWKSDGTSAGTSVFYTRPRAEQGLYENSATYVIPEQAVLGEKVFFTAANGLMRELWVSDGSETGTQQLFAETSRSGIIHLLSWNGVVYFEARDTLNKGLWRTDGTATGTVPVKQFDAATNFYGLVKTNTSLYFIAGVSGAMQLWKSDGSEAGTVAAVNLPSYIGFGDEGLPGLAEVAGEHLFFTASEQTSGRELWVSDGTQAGTHITRNIAVSFTSSVINGLKGVGDRVFFLEGRFPSYDFWVSDGSEAGTLKLRAFGSISPGLGSVYGTQGEIIDLNGKAFLSGWDNSAWLEPWISDGTEAGTQRIKDINQQPSIHGLQPNMASLPYNMAVINGKAIFSANDGIHGRELWLSDGTEAGTQLLTDLNPGPIGSSPWAITSFGSFAIFAASNGPNGVEVWRTDGTAAGTRQLVDVAPGPGSSNPHAFILAGDKLFFMANDGKTGTELHMFQLPVPGPYRLYLPSVSR